MKSNQMIFKHKANVYSEILEDLIIMFTKVFCATQTMSTFD